MERHHDPPLRAAMTETPIVTGLLFLLGGVPLVGLPDGNGLWAFRRTAEDGRKWPLSLTNSKHVSCTIDGELPAGVLRVFIHGPRAGKCIVPIIFFGIPLRLFSISNCLGLCHLQLLHEACSAALLCLAPKLVSPSSIVLAAQLISITIRLHFACPLTAWSRHEQKEVSDKAG